MIHLLFKTYPRDTLKNYISVVLTFMISLSVRVSVFVVAVFADDIVALLDIMVFSFGNDEKHLRISLDR
jgi:hypothetical protein